MTTTSRSPLRCKCVPMAAMWAPIPMLRGRGYPAGLRSGPNIANNSNSFRTYPGQGDITAMENNTNGSYNGLQTGVRVQNRWGLSGELDYTYSHEIDIQNSDNACCVSNPWNLKYDKGAGATTTAATSCRPTTCIKLPIFNHSRRDWLSPSRAAGRLREPSSTRAERRRRTPPASALPVWVTRSVWVAVTPTAPMSVARLHYTKHVKGWFDTSQLLHSDAGVAGRPEPGLRQRHKDAVVGPGRVNFNTSLYKSFSMTERAHSSCGSSRSTPSTIRNSRT